MGCSANESIIKTLALLSKSAEAISRSDRTIAKLGEVLVGHHNVVVGVRQVLRMECFGNLLFVASSGITSPHVNSSRFVSDFTEA